jgi:hypothetical protein
MAETGDSLSRPLLNIVSVLPFMRGSVNRRTQTMPMIANIIQVHPIASATGALVGLIRLDDAGGVWYGAVEAKQEQYPGAPLHYSVKWSVIELVE